MNREQTEETQLFILGNSVFTLPHELGRAPIMTSVPPLPCPGSFP
jgi:hypothetical protein